MSEMSVANLSAIKPLNQSTNKIQLNSSSANLKHFVIESNGKSSKFGSTKTLKSSASHNEFKQPPFYPASTQMSSKSLKKSIAENNHVTNENEKVLYSTWTPLSDEKYNHKLFEERKQLFTKWFETWNESQRKVAIEEILNLCKPKQLFFTRDTLNKISPVYHLDFTRILPRVICLYIMSFLDPRSLSRCSQVCWYWKMLAESDQLWMPKCLRFGWNLNYIPSSFENGIWKQFYIENIKALQYIPVRKPSATPIATERSEVNLHDLSYGRFGFNRFIKGSKTTKVQRTDLKQPPWRANNSNPNHFYRYNYLDNEEDSNDKKRTDRLIKTLTLDSSLKQHTLTSSSFKNSTTKLNESKQPSLTNDESNSNQAKIENLLSKGQTLINQLVNESKTDKFTTSFQTSDRKTPDLFNATRGTTSKQVKKVLNTSSNSEHPKSAWTLLDKSDNDEM